MLLVKTLVAVFVYKKGATKINKFNRCSNFWSVLNNFIMFILTKDVIWIREIDGYCKKYKIREGGY